MLDWNDHPVSSAEGLEKALRSLSDNADCFSRGQARAAYHLQPSIDRNANLHTRQRERLAEENGIINEFRERANRFFPPFEQNYLHHPDPLASMSLMQHFGAPTRLLDWSRSPWVAAYFAVIDDHDEDAAVWWFRAHALERALNGPDGHNGLWERLGWREPGSDADVDLQDHIFNPECPEFICTCNLHVAFPRAAAQQGCFTIGAPLGREHQDLLATLLNKEDYGRIVIPSALKRESLQMLKVRNVDAQSLQHAGADHVGHSMSRNLQASRNRGLSSCMT